MRQDTSHKTEAAELRRRAEARLQNATSESNQLRSIDENQRIVHELEVHRIQLEMQNAELSQLRDEAELSLETYTDLYDFAPVGYITLDREGVIRAANFTAAGLCGTERSRLSGGRFDRYVANQFRTLFSEFIQNVFEHEGRQSCEVTLTSESDSTIVVQMEANTVGVGRECLVAIIDVTERRRTEDALKISEIRYRRLFETTRNGLLILNAVTGQIIDANPYLMETLGYSHADLLGRKIWEIGAFVDIENSKASFASLQQLEYGVYENLPLITKDGRQIYVEFVSNVYTVGDTKLIQCNIRDISNRKQAQDIIERLNTDLAARAAELEAANLELEAFNYSVAHDLRQPLNVISSYCQAIKELCGDKLNEQCRRYIQGSYEGTLRMSRMIEALLNFSRMGQVEPRREMVDLGAMASEVITMLKMTEPKREVDFRTIDGICACGDANLLRVVLENLLGNAWKYTGMQDTTVIEFGVSDTDGTTVYFVRDNGSGFNMADQDKLFIPFQRLPGSEECRGFGIGLATVERIIRRHGGKVWAEGEPDKGATFYFSLAG
jgi:PAS domain S-box-containing protein